MSNFNPNKYLHKENTTSPWLILPFILTLTIIPFVLGIYGFDPNLGEHYWTAGYSGTDIFLYYKSIWLVAFGAIMAGIFIVYRFMTKRTFSFGIAMIPLYVYIGCIILSTIFSTSPEHSLHGIQHHFESVFVLLTYCMLVLYAAYFIDSEKALKWFINGFLIGVALLALFGVFQFSSGLVASLYENGTLSTKSSFYEFMNRLFGCVDKNGVFQGTHWYEKLEPFKTDWMAEYVYAPLNTDEVGKLTLNFPLGQVYMTLYNPNYVAFFTTLTAPFFATLAFFQKKLWRKIVFALVSVASIICLFGSQSVAGFISLFVSAAILVVAFRRKIFKKWIPWVCTFAVLIVGLVVLDFATSHSILEKINYAKHKITTSITSGYRTTDWHHFTNITSTPDGIVITHNDTDITFTMDYDTQKGITCTFKDEDGNAFETKNVTTSDGELQTYLVDDSMYNGEIFAVHSDDAYIPTCTLYVDGVSWLVTNQIPTMCYSYDSDEESETPFIKLQKSTDETIGKYYHFESASKAAVVDFFQSFITDTDALKRCLKQLALAEDYYSEVSNSIFSSDNPSAAAVTFFNEMLEEPDELAAFFYYMTITSENDNNYYYRNQYGNWTQIGEQPETSTIFEDYPRFASGRGFIWSRTVPIMFDSVHNFLLGTGPDTFVLNYPHYDYVNLYRADYGGQIITKPHSTFLQIATLTGVPSLIAVLALYIIYLITTIKLYWKSEFTTLTSKVSVAILASTSGYMVSALTNDSTVTYSYVFWGLLGVGIAVNRMEKRQRQDEIDAKERAMRIEQQRIEREERKKKKAEASK